MTLRLDSDRQFATVGALVLNAHASQHQHKRCASVPSRDGPAWRSGPELLAPPGDGRWSVLSLVASLIASIAKQTTPNESFGVAGRNKALQSGLSW